MRRSGAIADALADDDRTKTQTFGVGGGGPDTGAGAAAGNQNRIDPMLKQITAQMGSAESARVLFFDDVILGLRSQTLVDPAGVFVPDTESF